MKKTKAVANSTASYRFFYPSIWFGSYYVVNMTIATVTVLQQESIRSAKYMLRYQKSKEPTQPRKQDQGPKLNSITKSKKLPELARSGKS